MQVLTTPDECFTDLVDFDFKANYLTIAFQDISLRMHYLDEGDPNARHTVLLLHGEPTWSFLYRKMIPPLVNQGYRVLAPDLIGFGRSDKLREIEDYSYQRHVDWLTAWFDALNLKEVTLFCQDWGGLLGLRVVADRMEQFARVVAANTGLPTGEQTLSDAFFAWQNFAKNTQDLPIGHIVNNFGRGHLTEQEINAYNAPFPDPSYKAGARAFPLLVPSQKDDPGGIANKKAWQVLTGFDKPFLTAFSDGDPITKGGEAVFQKSIPGAKGLSHPTIKGASHFLQEEKGLELSQIIIDFIETT